MQNQRPKIIFLLVGICLIQFWIVGILSQWIYTEAPSDLHYTRDKVVYFIASIFTIPYEFYIPHLLTVVYFIWIVLSKQSKLPFK